ncbi:hypothetical protein CEUSTIGMA_g3659.t1 [Chlamydomonas eustigma]|uniref:PWWP domain-containing protein n=1 Tax=Chlamydomonas eustigma TaxID=1157962 RepID=A0A250WZK5_9CHLO|nr:hypothetical protein CEUSTIGMA_g3659.t1 [Chlamydomonas eustigma]|eukprot:GAX76215.1 hypothetical protein CEUSTIGMA_g3659.t1 [Chlamydomonas eustigma]
MGGPPPRHPGTLVWCKLKGFVELWAGQIVDPALASDEARKTRVPDTFLVSFFPDNRFQWVPPDKIFDFEEHFDKHSKQQKSGKLWKRGVEEAKELLDKRNSKDQAIINVIEDSTAAKGSKQNSPDGGGKGKGEQKGSIPASAPNPSKPSSLPSKIATALSNKNKDSLPATTPGPNNIQAGSNATTPHPAPPAHNPDPAPRSKRRQSLPSAPSGAINATNSNHTDPKPLGRPRGRTPAAGAAGTSQSLEPSPSSQAGSPASNALRSKATPGSTISPAVIAVLDPATKSTSDAIAEQATTVVKPEPWRAEAIGIDQPQAICPAAAVSTGRFFFTFSRFPDLRPPQPKRPKRRISSAISGSVQPPSKPTASQVLNGSLPAGQSGAAVITSPYADWSTYIEMIRVSPADLKATSAKQALHWLRNVAKGDNSSQDMTLQESAAATSPNYSPKLRWLIALDRQCRCDALMKLPIVASEAAGFDVGGNGDCSAAAAASLSSPHGDMDRSKRLPRRAPLSQTKKITIPDALAAANGATSPLMASVDTEVSMVSVILNINDQLLPFLSPATIHPGVVVSRTDLSLPVHQVHGLQGALAAFAPCSKTVESWKQLAPGLLQLSLSVSDLSSAVTPTPPPPVVFPRALTTAKTRAETGAAASATAGAMGTRHQTAASASAAASSVPGAAGHSLRMTSLNGKPIMPRIILKKTMSVGNATAGKSMEGTKRVKLVLQQHRQRDAAADSADSDGSGGGLRLQGQGRGKGSGILLRTKLASQSQQVASVIGAHCLVKQVASHVRAPIKITARPLRGVSGAANAATAARLAEPSQPSATAQVRNAHVLPSSQQSLKRPREILAGGAGKGSYQHRLESHHPEVGEDWEEEPSGTNRQRGAGNGGDRSRARLRPRGRHPSWQSMAGDSISDEDYDVEEEDEDEDDEDGSDVGFESGYGMHGQKRHVGGIGAGSSGRHPLRKSGSGRAVLGGGGRGMHDSFKRGSAGYVGGSVVYRPGGVLGRGGSQASGGNHHGLGGGAMGWDHDAYGAGSMLMQQSDEPTVELFEYHGPLPVALAHAEAAATAAATARALNYGGSGSLTLRGSSLEEGTDKNVKNDLTGPGKIIVEFLLSVDDKQDTSAVPKRVSKAPAAAESVSPLPLLQPSVSNAAAAVVSTFSTLQFAQLWEAHVGAGSRLGVEDEEDLDALYM